MTVLEDCTWVIECTNQTSHHSWALVDYPVWLMMEIGAARAIQRGFANRIGIGIGSEYLDLSLVDKHLLKGEVIKAVVNTAFIFAFCKVLQDEILKLLFEILTGGLRQHEENKRDQDSLVIEDSSRV